MQNRKTFTLMVMLAFTLALLPTVGHTQHIYNKERDEQAQRTLPLAASLKSGDLFDKQLKNLASLSRKDFETEFLVTKFQINSDSLSLLTWGSAHELVCRVKRENTDPGNIPDPNAIKDSLANLEAAIKSAQASLKAFKDAVKQNEVQVDPTLSSLFSRLGDLDTLKDFATQIGTANPQLVNSKTIEAIGEVQQILETIKGVYDSYAQKVDEFNKLNEDLADLRIVLKKVAIQSLQVDEEHWKNIGAIRARRETERADVLSLISQYKSIVKRLQLVDFDERNPDPNRRIDFCTAVDRAAGQEESVDFRSQQVIAEHLKEIVSRAQGIEKDNQEIKRQARTALGTLRGAPADVSFATRQTLAAFRDGINQISPDDTVHQYEQQFRNGWRDDHATLVTAINSASAARVVNALRLIIFHAERNTVRSRDMVGDIPLALYTVAALIARGSTPNRLADLRFAQELHAYSIRKSALRARAYELTVSTGAQRLALFHKGGIKPTDVAELVFAASNVAITPAILGKK
jgi:hypothetical protein